MRWFVFLVVSIAALAVTIGLQRLHGWPKDNGIFMAVVLGLTAVILISLAKTTSAIKK